MLEYALERLDINMGFWDGFKSLCNLHIKHTSYTDSQSSDGRFAYFLWHMSNDISNISYYCMSIRVLWTLYKWLAILGEILLLNCKQDLSQNLKFCCQNSRLWWHFDIFVRGKFIHGSKNYFSDIKLLAKLAILLEYFIVVSWDKHTSESPITLIVYATNH